MSATSWYRCNCFYTNNYFIKLNSGHSTHLTYHPNTTRMRQENFYQLRHDLKIGSVAELPVVIDQLNVEYKRRKSLDLELENAKSSIQASFENLISPNFNKNPEITEISKNIYRVGPIFKNLPAIKNHLNTFSAHCRSNNLPFARPNSMNKYGVLLPKNVLNTDELTEFFKNLFCDKSIENRFNFKLDSQRVFTVEYGTGKDSDLDLHFDDSELTANICLENEDENDGKLFFQKRVQNGEHFDECFFDQIENYAIVHEGKFVHSAENSQKNRMNLIVWMRDSEVRGKLCKMCGEVPDLSDEPRFEYAGGFKK